NLVPPRSIRQTPDGYENLQSSVVVNEFVKPVLEWLATTLARRVVGPVSGPRPRAKIGAVIALSLVDHDERVVVPEHSERVFRKEHAAPRLVRVDRKGRDRNERTRIKHRVVRSEEVRTLYEP